MSVVRCWRALLLAFTHHLQAPLAVQHEVCLAYRQTCACKMSQRSITSFFSAKAKSPSSVSKIPAADDKATEERSFFSAKAKSPSSVSKTPAADDKATEERSFFSAKAKSPSSVSKIPAADDKATEESLESDEHDQSPVGVVKRRRAVIESDSSSSCESDPEQQPTSEVCASKEATGKDVVKSATTPNGSADCTTDNHTGSSPASAVNGGGLNKQPASSKQKPTARGKTASKKSTKKLKSSPASGKTVSADDATDSGAPESNNGAVGDQAGKRNSQGSKTANSCAADDEAVNRHWSSGSSSDVKSCTPIEENSYDPTKSDYHPVQDAVWKQHQKVPYLALARTFQLIEETSGRLKIVHLLANYLRSVMVLSPDDLLPSVYLCLNQLAPAYHGIELGVGEMVITRALAQATGRTVDKVKREAAARGDLGVVAELSKSHQRLMFRPQPLTVATVFAALKDIALMSGHAVVNKKMAKIQSLLVACRHAETRFVVRSLSGKLRIGLAEQSVLQALGQACAMTPPGSSVPLEPVNHLSSLSSTQSKAAIDQAALIIKTAYCECPTYDEIIAALLQHGVDQLSVHCRIRAGVPLKPMLAHPTKGVSEVLSRFEGAQFTCEYKYDGERAQVHLDDNGCVRVFSRNQEDNTSKYPDIVARFRQCLADNVTSCILDSEAVAWDTVKQQILPFQVLSTRKRKDAESSEIKIQVQVFAFDLLFLNGESLVEQPFEKRRQKLRSSFHTVEGEFSFAKSMDSNNVEDIAEFLDESVKGNCEGLMVKTLKRDATYEIAKRSRNWLKLKKDYLDGVGDTIDVVVLGGFLGKGKRAGVYGGFLLACYDPDNEEFQSICKIGTGFSDEDLQKHAIFFKQHVIDTPKSYYSYSIEPDHWFEAVQVWEIKCADLSLSPVHRAAVGLVDGQRGISLRFPRFLRVRDDKAVEQATSARQVADMYNNQDQVKNQASSGKCDEEEFY